MDVLNKTPLDNEKVWRIIIPSQAGAAISQLTDAEQDGVQHGLNTLQRDGIDPANGLGAHKLDSPEPLYVLDIPAAPDVRLIVRVVDDDTIEVEDVVRPTTLRNVFHARAS